MTLTNIRKPFITTASYRPVEEWLWEADLTVDTSYSAPAEYVTLGYPLDNYNTTTVLIGNVYVDGVAYTEEDTRAECMALESSWYFDQDAQRISIHPDHSKRMDSSQFDTLRIYGHNDTDVFYDSNDNEYLPYLNSGITIRESADRLVYNKISFPEQNLQFNNSDGNFDSFFSNPTPGSDVEYKYLSKSDFRAGKKTLTDIYIGYVYKDSLGRDEYSLTVKDKRAQLSDTWPKDVYSVDDYPDIDDKYIDDTIPDGFGTFDVPIPAFCVNGTLTSGEVWYKYANFSTQQADYPTSTPTVEVEIDDVWTEVTVSSYDFTNGEFTLTEALGRDSSGNPYTARISDITLRGLATNDTNQVDILKLLMAEAGYDYNAELWDTTKVSEEETAYLTAYSNLYTKKEQKFSKYIQEIQGGGEYGFRLSYGADRRWTIQCDDIHRAVKYEYGAEDNIDDVVSVPRDFTEYATSVNVNYAYNPNSEEWESYYEDTRETDIFDTYRVYQNVDFDSNLISEVDAANKADHLAEDYAVARGQISFKIDELKTHMLYDIVNIDTSVYNKYGVMTREYLGTRKIKLSEIKYDFDNEQTTLQGYDITEVE